jgi:hypothetical protein
MRVVARILFDESHRQAWSTRPEVASRMRPGNPADCGLVEAARTLHDNGFAVAVHATGPLSPDVLASADVLVVPHCSTDEWEATTGQGSPVYEATEIDAIEAFVHAGGGLVVLAETEQPKYGNSLAAIAARFGIGIDNATVQDPAHRFKDVSTWVLVDPAPPPAGDGGLVLRPMNLHLLRGIGGHGDRLFAFRAGAGPAGELVADAEGRPTAGADDLDGHGLDPGRE